MQHSGLVEQMFMFLDVTCSWSVREFKELMSTKMFYFVRDMQPYILLSLFQMHMGLFFHFFFISYTIYD